MIFINESKKVFTISILIIFLILGLSNIAYAQNSSKVIIFRDDDAEADWSLFTLQNITNTLINNNIPQTIAVIPGESPIGTDTQFKNYLNSIKNLSTVELAMHGYDHSIDEFKDLNLSQAEQSLQLGLTIFKSELGITPTTFIPPYFEYNNYTLQACKNKNFTRFSASVSNDYFREYPPGLLHLPGTVDFYDWDKDIYLNSSTIINKCQNSLNDYDTCVLIFHHWQFSTDNKTVDPALYKILLDVINWSKSKQSQGILLMTMTQCNQTGSFKSCTQNGNLSSCSIHISSGNDDAYEASGVMQTNESVIMQGKAWGTTYRGGYIFRNITIPKGAAIVRANLSLSYNWGSGSNASIDIYGENTSNSLIFSSSNNDISNRVKTTAKVDWNNLPNTSSTGTRTFTPDISSILQEIVNRVDWSSGNAMTFLFYEDPAAIDEWESISFEGYGNPTSAAAKISKNSN